MSPTFLPTTSPSITPSVDPFRVVLAACKSAAQESTQSSDDDEYDPAAASRAIDGNIDGNMKHKSCTFTRSSERAWWRVELKHQYYIAKVVVWNRQDCCAEQLNDVVVQTGRKLTSGGWSWHGCAPKITKAVRQNTLMCNFMRGNFVQVLRKKPGVLSLCEVQVYGSLGIPPPSMILKLSSGRPTTQSSEMHNGASSRAVDGLTNGDYKAGTCTHTQRAKGAWWQVDLGKNYYIDRAIVWNRQDCCMIRLNHFSVKVQADKHRGRALKHGWQTCGSVRIAQQRNVISCNFRYARYLKVVLEHHSYLTLCEVEVLGSLRAPPPTLAPSGTPSYAPSRAPPFKVELVSRNKPAMQGDVKNGGVASRAVDGKRNGSFMQGSCTQTAAAPGSWWRVDLEGVFHVQKVVVWNRQDCCGDNLNHFVAQTGLRKSKGPEGIAWHTCGRVAVARRQNTIGCAYDKAQFVRIQLLRARSLTLCEVEVYGSITLPSAKLVYLLSSGRPATQSDTIGIGGANKAVDSELSGDFSQESCTQTKRAKKAWWQVDLLHEALIDHVVVWNRSDCCSSRLNGFRVMAGMPKAWNVCGEVKVAHRKSKIGCRRTRARFVRVQLLGTNYLTLCEVEVYGSRT